MNRKTIKQNIYHSVMQGNEHRITVMDNYMPDEDYVTYTNFEAETLLTKKLSWGQFNKLVDVVELTKNINCPITIKFMKHTRCIFIEIDANCERTWRSKPTAHGFVNVSSKGRIKNLFCRDFFGIYAEDNRKSARYHPQKQSAFYDFLHRIKDQSLRHNLKCKRKAAA